jgi:hypothetical protein
LVINQKPLSRFTAYRSLVNISHPTNFYPLILLNQSQRQWNIAVGV